MIKRISRIWALFKRECLSMAVTPSTYVAVTLFVIIISLGFYLSIKENNLAFFEPVAVLINFLCIFFVPLITMRIFSEERRNGTIEILMTAPVTLFDVIISKLSAAYLFYLIMLSPCAVFILLLMWAGDVDSGAVLTAVLGLLLVGGVYVSAGIMVSSVTRSQIAAAMGAMGVIFIFWAVWFMGDSSFLAGKVIRYISFKDHFDYSLAKGVLDSGDLVYFFSVTFIFIFLNYIFLNGSLAIAGGDDKKSGRFLDAIFAFLFVECVLFGVAYLHITQLSVAVVKDWLASGKYNDFALIILPFAFSMLFGGIFVLRVFKGRRGVFAPVFRQRNFAGVILGIIGTLMLVVNLNIFASRYVWRVDISETKLNTLNIATREALDKLQEPVHIQVFFSAYNDSYENFPLLERTKALLFEYGAYSGNVLLDFYDPGLMPAICRKIAHEKGLDYSRLSSFSLVEYQGRRVILPWEFIIPQDVNMFGQKYRQFNGESAFTSAIKRVMDPRMPVIYLTEQHGEFDSYRNENVAQSVTGFMSELRMDGFIIKRFPFSGKVKIPDDCDLLIMPGPNRPFSADEVSTLKQYIENGGRAFIMLEPPLGAGLNLGIEPLLETWGAKINDDILFDPRNNVGGASGNILAVGNPSHSITASAQRVVCFLQRGRSLGVRSGGKVKQGWSGVYLLTSSENSVSVAVDDVSGANANRAGGFACAIALENDKKSRIVVAGDADMAGNVNFNKWHNRAFLISAVHWLLDRDNYKIQIPERQDKDRTLRLTAYEERIFFWITLVALPQLALIAGGLIWWLRRQ